MQLYFQHAIIILYQYESLFCKCHSANRSLLIYYTTYSYLQVVPLANWAHYFQTNFFLQACKKTCDMNVVFSVALNFVEAACSSSLISRGVATAGSAKCLIGTIPRGVSVSSQDQTRDLVRRTCKPPHSGESERSKSEILARVTAVICFIFLFPPPPSPRGVVQLCCCIISQYIVVLYHSIVAVRVEW